jgi:NAD(P)-dependent dehydrogenase (short-subunit alcohol dehydrogenase family)
MQDLSNKTVVVTGASAGVGRAIATRFGAAGASVGLIARDGEALAEVKQEIERRGGKAVVAAADVADADAVFAAADKVAQQLGPIEVWVNDAMVTVFSPVWDTTPAEFRRVTEVTYLGAVHGTMAALRHMRPRNQGTIIQIGWRWRIAAFPCNPPIAVPNMPFAASPTRCAPSLSMTQVRFASRSWNCRRSTRRNSTGRVPI